MDGSEKTDRLQAAQTTVTAIAASYSRIRFMCGSLLRCMHQYEKELLHRHGATNYLVARGRWAMLFLRVS
ncbi:hypothetical protein LLF88_04055 [bacterium]|nr:hypothetical protein [bacterium]